ncbi:TlpA family protein disulfide reductase [Nonomuraea sp. MG754425]|uniref:TlpA family protein disulfide reductase n=1 Tax=Nonomuraea sp. MG754425 TaxID=2570319 RepID=UPI001F46EEE6|nr:TlpA disulfide reductase family protein [Nonomuraea sp. MG754425]MCF6471904.1 TlpA family protein disulfide reductase [Nonomuraea sp. MG754425]
MEYLAAAVVVVGLLCMVNLLLMVGVIRRLRKLAARPAYGLPPTDGLAVGERMPEFAATTTAGEPISHDLLGGPALVGFFTPGCEPCQELLPRFVARAREFHGQALAVVVATSAEDAAEEAEHLAGVARVVVEEPGGALQDAFSVSGYPTVYVIDADGAVAGTDLDALALVQA